MPNNKYNRLTIIKVINKNGRKYAICKCDCGNIKTIEYNKVVRGLTKSCGCLSKEKAKKQGLCNRKYNLEDKELWKRWRCIKQRCSKSSDKKNRYYDRGIDLCFSWKTDFNSFKEWALDNGWKVNLTIERIDNNKGYSPENCIWCDRKRQARNRENSHFVLYKGKKITISELSDIVGINYKTLYGKIRKLEQEGGSND